MGWALDIIIGVRVGARS